MLDSIVDYLRSWFPERRISGLKRRGSTAFSPRGPKIRKALSPMSANNYDNIFISSSSKLQNPIRVSADNVLIDLVDEPVTKYSDMKWSKRLESNSKPIAYTVDLTVPKNSSARTPETKKNGYEYVTRFSSTLDSLTTKSPIQNRLKHRSKFSPIFKTPKYSSSRLNTPSLDYSIRLDDKRKYQMLLDSFAKNNSLNNTSIYGTPVGSFNRSRMLVDLARTPNKKSLEVIDLTNDTGKLSTKDTVIKILDDFDSDPAAIEDSDSDVEILPNPPSPKPFFKIRPVNTLKTVVDTSKVAREEWLIDVTNKHEKFVVNKQKEVDAYTENSTALNEINKDLLLQSLTKKVKESLSIKEQILPLEEEEEEVELPPLTEEQLLMVKRGFSGDKNEILTKKFNLNVNRRDLLTLANLNWLNDNVINFYMNLIIERGTDSKWPRAYAMNTFFYQKLSTSGPDSLKRWTRRIDLFSYEFVCVPIHLGMHWCMAIINLREKSIKYYDSMGISNDKCLNALRDYLEFEHQDKKGQPFSTDDFILENVQKIPQQMNGSDCGMFSCTFAEFATRKSKFTFQQADMPYLRKKMVVEILTGQLLIQ